MANYKKLIGFLFCLLSLQTCRSQFEPRENLSFETVAIYDKPKVKYLGVRGSGLGLSWTETRPMKLNKEGVWSLQIDFKSDWKGFYCNNCSNEIMGFIPNGDDLKIEFWIKTTDTEHETRMVGDFYRIPLPQSKVSTYFSDIPKVTFYPYFFNLKGVFEVLEVVSPVETIGERRMVLYLPPGFIENPRPEYDIYYIIDLAPEFVEYVKPDIDKIFIDGTAHDAVIIGHGDYRVDPLANDTSLDRMLQLTPSVGITLVCNEGTFFDLCNNCLPQNFTVEEFYYWMTEGGCGHIVEAGGNGNANIDFLLNEVYDAVNLYLSEDYGSGLTKSRDGTFMIGYSLGGLITCHAAWTRPKNFGGAACQSSSFWWPTRMTEDGLINVFEFINSTLPAFSSERLPQKILIDVGDLENDSMSLMINGADKVYSFLSEHPMFEENRNLWLNVYPGKAHGLVEFFERIWNGFKILSQGRN